jgi:hypothetical protein
MHNEAMTPPKRTLSAAARRTLAAMKAARSLEATDELSASTVLWLANRIDQLDDTCGPAQTASLARVLLAATRDLLHRDDGNDHGEFDELIAALATPFGPAIGPMGDAVEPSPRMVNGEPKPW